MRAYGRDEVPVTNDVNDELARLRAENARLLGLLEAHGIARRETEGAAAAAAAVPLRTDEKIFLFRRLFRSAGARYRLPNPHTRTSTQAPQELAGFEPRSRK